MSKEKTMTFKHEDYSLAQATMLLKNALNYTLKLSTVNVFKYVNELKASLPDTYTETIEEHFKKRIYDELSNTATASELLRVDGFINMLFIGLHAELIRISNETKAVSEEDTPAAAEGYENIRDVLTEYEIIVKNALKDIETKTDARTANILRGKLSEAIANRRIKLTSSIKPDNDVLEAELKNALLLAINEVCRHLKIDLREYTVINPRELNATRFSMLIAEEIRYIIETIAKRIIERKMLCREYTKYVHQMIGELCKDYNNQYVSELQNKLLEVINKHETDEEHHYKTLSESITYLQHNLLSKVLDTSNDYHLKNTLRIGKIDTYREYFNELTKVFKTLHEKAIPTYRLSINTEALGNIDYLQGTVSSVSVLPETHANNEEILDALLKVTNLYPFINIQTILRANNDYIRTNGYNYTTLCRIVVAITNRLYQLSIEERSIIINNLCLAFKDKKAVDVIHQDLAKVLSQYDAHLKMKDTKTQ